MTLQSKDPDETPAGVRRLLWALLLPGLALVGVGAGLGVPGLAPLGTILLGAALAATGAEMVRSRRHVAMSSLHHRARREHFSGSAAVAWGVFALLVGGAVAVAGGLALTGLQAAAGRLVLARPSLALLPAGIALGSLATAYLIGSDTWRDRSLLMLVASAPHRIGGLILLLAALALLGLGGLELLAPERFDRWVDSFR